MRVGFKNFFQTRDGQGNIVIPSNTLKTKFKNLWYNNPLNPFQQFSNAFILAMAEYRLQFEANLRSCELWCRKMCVERMCTTKCSIKMEYLLQEEGLRQITKERYPEVAQKLANYEEGGSSKVSHFLYDCLCKYEEGLEEAEALAKESVQKCEAQITFCSQQKSEGEQMSFRK